MLVFHQVGPWELTQLVRRLVTNGYSPSEDFEYLQAPEFTVRISEPTANTKSVPMELDGELRGETPAHFRLAEHQLTVAV